MVTVSECLTGEEGIKTDYIVQHQLSRYPVQSPAMLDQILLNVKIKLAVSFQSFAPIGKTQQK